MSSSKSSKSIAIIGGGPVGSLAALYFSKYFTSIIIYELRPGIHYEYSINVDPRIDANKAILLNKSINLALSDRGILGLKGISQHLADEVLAKTIPMKGRCLHDREGNQVTQFYDVYRRVPPLQSN